MADAKTLAAISQTYPTFQNGDLLGLERAGVAGKMTFSEFQANDFAWTGDHDFTGGTVLLDGGPLDALGATSIDGVTGADVKLVTGTAGADGTVITWNSDGDAVEGPSLAAIDQTTLGTQSTTTGGGAIGFTSIPAGTDFIRMMIDGVSLSGTDSLLIQLGDAGGYEATGYAGGFQSSGSLTEATNGFIFPLGNAATVLFAVVEISRMSGNKWIANGTTYTASGAIGRLFGIKTLSAELDRVQVTASGSNTIDANAGVNIAYR